MGRRGMQAARSLRDLWRASRPMTREKAHAAMGKWQWRSASFPIERLEDVSESLLAVAATLQVTTITFDPDTANGEGYWDYLFSVDSLSRYQAFAIGFLAVMWFRWFHCTLFSAVARPSGRVRPLTFALNAVFLLLVCLIPFSTAMVSSNPNKDSVVAFMHTIVSITAFSLLLVALSLHRQRALVRKGYESVVKLLVIQLGFITLTAAILAVVFSATKDAHKRVEWGPVIYVIVPYLVRSIWCRLGAEVREIERHHMPDTSRIEAFADGVFSLSATLAVTDFAATIPTSDNSTSAFRHSAPDILSFCVMFVVAFVLWSGNHHVYFSGDTATPSVLENLLNTALLLFCGIVPFASNVLGHAFHGTHSSNRMYAARFFSMVTFAAGLLNVGMALTRACRTNWKMNRGLPLQAAILPLVTAIGQGLTEITQVPYFPIYVLPLLPVIFRFLNKREERMRLKEQDEAARALFGSPDDAGDEDDDAIPFDADRYDGGRTTSGGAPKDVAAIALDGGDRALLDDDEAGDAVMAAEGAGDLVVAPAGLEELSVHQLRERVTQLTFEGRQLYMEVLRLRAVTGEVRHLDHMGALAPAARESFHKSKQRSGRLQRFSIDVGGDA